MQQAISHKTYGHWQGCSWLEVPSWGITISAPPKAGSSTLRRFFYNSDVEYIRLPCYAVKYNTYDIYFVVREPVARFKSLWRNKCRDHGNWWKQIQANPKGRLIVGGRNVYGKTPEELMDHIESGARDIHWTPQIELLNNLDATVIPLEHLSDWWASQGYGELEQHNQTDGEVPLDEKLQQRVLDFYADDVHMYQEAIRNTTNTDK